MSDLAQMLRDVLQGASNSAASTVSAPVDALAWALKKAGAGGLLGNGPPVGGSDWMAQKGLTAEPKNALAGMAGETMGLLSPIGVAAKAPQIARGLLSAGENALARTSGAGPSNMSQMGQRGAIVYHGSPHTFDKFDMSKIGTGEGAQAYGHGLYFAENPGVATEYQKTLSRRNDAPTAVSEIVGKPISHDRVQDMLAAANMARDADHAAQLVKFNVPGFHDVPLDTIKAAQTKARDVANGSLYKVDLPDEHIAKMLDWDKPLSQQHPAVQGLVKTDELGRAILPNGERVAPDKLRGESLYRAFAEAQGGNVGGASSALRQAGIPGIRYLDGGSRGTGAGTSNYVVFDDALPKIVERNGLLR